MPSITTHTLYKTRSVKEELMYCITHVLSLSLVVETDKNSTALATKKDKISTSLKVNENTKDLSCCTKRKVLFLLHICLMQVTTNEKTAWFN